MDSYQRGFQRREHQLAGAPGILEAASGATVVEAVKGECAGTIIVENLLGHAGIQRQGLIPAGIDPLVAHVDARAAQALLTHPLGVVHDLGQLAASRG
ncbi:hypothetical protein D9M68_800120 [compost metagenome]